MKNVQNYFEYGIILAIRALVRSLPLSWALKVADCLGLFAFSVIRIRRKVTLDNLHRAFPEKTQQDCENIAKRTYCNFAKTAVEHIRFPINIKELRNRTRFDHPELFHQAAQEGKGILCVSGHFGNWEMMAAAIRALGYPMVVVVAEQRNKFVDELINRGRRQMGIEMVGRGIAIRGILKALREKKMVALLGDQDAHEEGVFVDFMGRPSSTPQGPAVLCLKTGAPMICGIAVRKEHGKHQIFLQRVSHDDLTGVTAENIHILTQRYTQILEKYVRQYPDHWFWMHRRWKTKPTPNSEQ